MAKNPHMKKKNLSTEEWLALRKKGIGSSDMAAILGLTLQYRTPYDVWLDKTSPDIHPLDDTLRLFMGREMEDPIARWYAMQTGRRVVRDNKIRVHPQISYLLANVDRLVYPNAKDKAEGIGVGILECKTVGRRAVGKWGQEFPDQYYIQIQEQLLVTGYEFCDIAIVVGGNEDYFTFHILPNQQIFELILREASVFWEHVTSNTPPPMRAVDFNFIKPIEGSFVEADPAMIADFHIYRDLMKQENYAKKVRDEVGDRLKEFLGDSETLVHTSGEKQYVLVTWKGDPPGKKFNETLFAQEQEEMYTKYLIDKKPTRRFLTKEVNIDVKSEESTARAIGATAEQTPANAEVRTEQPAEK